MKRIILAVAVTVFSTVTLSFYPGLTVSSQDRTDRSGKIFKAERSIPNRYIVVFEDWAAGSLGDESRSEALAMELAEVYEGTIHNVYRHALNGFSVEMDPKQVEALSHDARVKYIEEDSEVSIDATQNNATWGLDRIDQRNLPLNSTYVYNATGSGVRAYIIDTGIRATHNDFGGRVIAGFTAINDGQGSNDCNGHGTHVAGTVGGTTWGVAKSVTLVPVRVLNCSGSGTNSGVIAGVDWVTQRKNASPSQPSVANMSLGGGANSSLDAAVNNSINAGVTYVVAAGNSNANACNYSPARVSNAITVGSTTSSDARSSFSNFGSCLDIFAPGSSIRSAWHTSNTATNTISGTSMASPHVAGVAALYLQGNSGASVSAVTSAIVNSATTNVLSGIGSGSPNRLLYSQLSGGGGPPTCSGGTYTGTLSGTGAAHIQPNGTYYQSTVSGVHSGNLTGPSNADFDLALYRWSGFSWVRVAVSQGTTSTENISYNGAAGYYYWRVYSYSGSGSYSLCTTRP